MSHDQSSRDAARGEATAITYVGVAIRWWWLLLAALIGGAIVGYLASSFMTPTYQASATLLVSQQQIPGVTQRNDVETSVMLSNTFTRLITVSPMITRAIETGALNVSPGEFEESIRVDSSATSPIVDISATSNDPALAAAMVNVLAQVFIASPELERAGGAGAVTIVSPAELPGAPVSPRPTLNAILGGTLAVIAALLLVLLVEHLREQRVVTRTEQPASTTPIGPQPAADPAGLPSTVRHAERRAEPKVEAGKSNGVR